MGESGGAELVVGMGAGAASSRPRMEWEEASCLDQVYCTSCATGL